MLCRLQLVGVPKFFHSITMSFIQPSVSLLNTYLVFLFTGPSSDALYRELWHACAGPLVTLPRQDERVYYFPQGHMEQVSDSVMHDHCLLPLSFTYWNLGLFNNSIFFIC